MPLINKKNFLPIVCMIYTGISIGKILLEALRGYKDPYYSENIITIFVITVIATAVVGIHYFLQNLPVIPVILGQYVVLLGLIFGYLWIEGHFSELGTFAYRDTFLSFTIPYVIAAGVYYISFFNRIRNANKMLDEIKKQRRQQEWKDR